MLSDLLFSSRPIYTEAFQGFWRLLIDWGKVFFSCSGENRCLLRWLMGTGQWTKKVKHQDWPREPGSESGRRSEWFAPAGLLVWRHRWHATSSYWQRTVSIHRPLSTETGISKTVFFLFRPFRSFIIFSFLRSFLDFPSACFVRFCFPIMMEVLKRKKKKKLWVDVPVPCILHWCLKGRQS